MALGGLLGFLLAACAVLFLRLRIRVELQTGRPALATAGCLGMRWTYRAERGAAPGGQKGGGSAGGPGAGQALFALRALLDPLRPVPVRGARFALRGGTGDAATTAVLYGALWAAISTWAEVSGTQPEMLRVEPTLEGAANLWAMAAAEIRPPLWRLVLGGLRALRALRSGGG